MLDKMTRDDLLPGMTVTTRSGAIGTVKICSVRFENREPVMTDDYTDDLYYGDGDEEHDLDIMRVALPSSAVIWERPVIELRVFEFELWKQTVSNEYYGQMMLHRQHMKDSGLYPWFDSCNGKIATFKSGAQCGSCKGYDISRAWTRELTDEERKNWKGARK